MTTPDELQRAVERLEKALKIADQYATGVHFGTGNDGFVSFATILALLSERAELLATVERMRAALKPFAKAATLFDMGDYINRDASIYEPVAGEEYYLNSGHLLAARAALTTGEEK